VLRLARAEGGRRRRSLLLPPSPRVNPTPECEYKKEEKEEEEEEGGGKVGVA